MINRKPQTAAGHRALKKKESQMEEGAKQAVFLRGTTTSQVVTDCMKDLLSLKKPDGKMFSKRNDIKPFDDPKQFEFLAQKNDAALFCFGSHSKKRPHNLVFTRMFEYELLDMVELGIQNFKKMADFKCEKPTLGNRPLLAFRGEHWDSSDELRTIRSILLDMYSGDCSADMLNLSNGITHSMVFTLVGTPQACRILLNVYSITLKKGEEENKPKVELTETGPYVEFVPRRTTLANADMMKESLRVPSLGKEKKQKNIERNDFGEKVGRVWMEKQDLNTLQTRKMKGLKRKAETETEAGAEAETEE